MKINFNKPPHQIIRTTKFIRTCLTSFGRTFFLAPLEISKIPSKIWCGGKFLQVSIVFLVIFAWIFSGYPQIWKNPRIPPEIQEAQAANVTYVNYSSAVGKTVTCTVTKPTGLALGDLMIAHLVWEAEGTGISGPSGWSTVGSEDRVSTGVMRSKLMYKIAVQADVDAASFAFTNSTLAQYVCAISVFRGHDPTTPINASNGQVNAASATVTSAGITPTVANTMILMIASISDDNTQSGYAIQYDNPAIWPEAYDVKDLTGTDAAAAMGCVIRPQTTATGNGTAISSASDINIGHLVAIKPAPPVTTLGNDASEPSNVTIGPGASATDLDNFTLKTDDGTDTVTAAVVTLGPAGAYNNIYQVDITDTSNVAKCTAVTGLTSNTVTFPASTCSIAVTTSLTTYKVRITPKTHAGMPYPGASYATTGTVTDITCTNSKSLNDSGSATITVDNASPADATWGTITPGDTQIVLNWSNPVSDFYRELILRKVGSVVIDTPTEGTEYVQDNTIGSSTVRYVGSLETFTDTGLTNGTNYYYKIFAYDSYINYAAGVGTGPHIPQAAAEVSVSVSDGVITYGTMAAGTSKSTLQLSPVDTQTLTNDGNVTETFNIKGYNAPCPWTLAATAGTDQYVHEFCRATDVSCTSPPTNYTALTTGYVELYTGVASSTTRQIDLRITTPTSTNCFTSQAVDVTIQATQ